VESDGQSLLCLPQDVNLPFFAYGALKPGELAYAQISDLVSGEPIAAKASGSLKVRDGLPLFEPSGSGTVRGFLLTFRPEKCMGAYDRIRRFEPKSIYRWKKLQLQTPEVYANVLEGRVPHP